MNTLLNYNEAKESPCMHCSSVECCQLLSLDEYPLLTLSDVDKTEYYLNFDRIEVVLHHGICSVYYSTPCRYFQDNRCSIHNQEEQPVICKYYNPYNCYYKKIDRKKNLPTGYFWLDQERLKCLAGLLSFDEERVIQKMPKAEVLLGIFEDLPYRRNHREGIETAEQPQATECNSACSVCAGCPSHCCSSLLFDVKLPRNEQNLDFINYTLGFEGITYQISETSWSMRVDARCRYLAGNGRCRIDNPDERPLKCKYNNPLHCEMRTLMDAPEGICMDHTNFYRIREGIQLDSSGNVKSIESLQEIKQKMEK